MQWHWLDWVIVSIIGVSILTGLFRGFVKECVAISVWVLALWLAFRYIHTIDPWLQPYLADKTARSIASFAIVFLAILLLGAILNTVLSFILKRSGLSGTDRLLGMGFGFLRGVFIVSLLIFAARMTSIPHHEYSKQSVLYAKFDPLVNWLNKFVPGFISKFKTNEEPESGTPVFAEDEEALLNDMRSEHS